MKPKSVIACVTIVASAAVIGLVQNSINASSSSLGGLTVTDIKTHSSVTTPDARVRGNSIANNTDLGLAASAGNVTDFYDSTAWGTNNGPRFATYRNGSAATGVWMGNAAGWASREGTTTGYGVALIPWLTHKSRFEEAIDANGVTTMDMGIIIGANSTGTSGVAARVFYSGGRYRLQLVNITGGASRTDCSAAGGVDIGTSTTIDRALVLTYDPSTNTATASSTGSVANNVSCTPTNATGRYAGLIGFTVNTTARARVNSTDTIFYYE